MYDNSNVRVVSGDYLKLTSLSLRYVVPEKNLSENVYEVSLSEREWNKSIYHM